MKEHLYTSTLFAIFLNCVIIFRLRRDIVKLKKEFKFVNKYLKEDKTKIILVISAILITSVIGLTYGYLVGQIVEKITQYDLKKALIYSFVYLFIELVVDLQLKKRSRLGLQKIKLNLTKKLSQEVFRKTLKLPSKAFEEKTSGEIINRVSSDTETVTDMIDGILNLSIDILGCLIILIYVFINSWIVGLEIIIFVVFLTIITMKFSPKIRKLNKDIRKINDDCIADINQCVIGIREIKSLGISSKVNSFMNNRISNMYTERASLAKYNNSYWTFIRAINCIYEVSVLITCGILVYNQMTTLSFFISMTYYLYRYMGVAHNLSDIIPNYQKMLVSVRRINELIQNEIYEDEQFGKNKQKIKKGNISFKNITFGYDKENIILKDFNMEIETNKKVAIVGPSGQGKSTIFNLLTRIFDPISGEILIDGINIQDFTEDNLHSTISIIRQEPFLFNKTIRENFLMVNDKLTQKAMIEYCKKAKIHDYIMTLPKQYDTLLGEGGVNLSGGQKQRIAIARALIKNSKIILFDEATSALDNNSQDYIKKTIDELSLNHTVIIVAHRLSTINDADIINVINEGKLVDSGTKDKLLKTSEIFKMLYNSETD